MTAINKPMGLPELNLQPPIEGKVRLSEDIQQTLALLCAMGDAKRTLVKASESGVLNVCDAQIKDIVHYTGSGAGDHKTGDDVPCTQVMVMGHPENGDTVWVRPNEEAKANNAWPLEANDVVSFSLSNLSQLNMLIVGTNERVIVAYTR